jgi:NADH-quinone oxidoreductase subunit C
VPDATGLELIAQDIREADPDAVLDAVHFRGRATLIVNPPAIRSVLEALRVKGYSFLASLHGVDYWPDEPRLGVIYELLDMESVDRISVKVRVHTEEPRVASVMDLWPGANHHEREVFDMFGVVFEGHPDLRRILMPEDYEGWPQRRDFPLGGEPVIFTYNEDRVKGYPE